MKSLRIVAIAIVAAGTVGACTYRHETVERPAPATVVATPAPAGTVVYTDPAPAASTTTVYTTR